MRRLRRRLLGIARGIVVGVAVKVIGLLAVGGAFGACAARTQGTVHTWNPLVQEGDELLVRVHRGQVALVGEKVDLYRRDCPRPGETATLPTPRSEECRMVRVGVGTVVDSLDRHHAVVHLAPGTRLPPGAELEMSPTS